MIPSRATAAGTRSYRRKHPDLDVAVLGATGLAVSQVGFGGYRIAKGVPAHHEALAHALTQGVNLVDTSTNYGDGQSDALVGEVLADLIASGRISREEVVIVSKVGYLQGTNFELSRQRKAQGRPFPELVPYGEGLEHCLHPEFIDDQLGRSLERLGLATLDFYLLHNPEYFLGWGSRSDFSAVELRREYERRLEAAFRHLEREVAAGRLQYYGVSSNTLPMPPEHPEFTDLAALERIAARVSADNHFRLIQLPFNLLETGAVLETSQPGAMTVLARAASRGLGVLVNRPLNAFDGRQLLRLAEPEERREAANAEVIAAIRALVRSETTFVSRIVPGLDVPQPLQQRLKDQVAIAGTLKNHWRNFGSYERWRQARDGLFLPRVEGVLDYLKTHAAHGEGGAFSWLEAHPRILDAAFRAVGSAYVRPLRRRLAELKARVEAAEAQWGEASGISRMAVRALRSTLGVSAVLVGMRKTRYVEEMITELKTPIFCRERTPAWRSLSAPDSDRPPTTPA